MSTKSREVIFGSRIRGAKIHADGARERAKQAVREADRAEAEAWSIRMEGYGGPAQPSPTIGECLNGGLALQLLLWEMSESMGNHDSEVVDASSVD
jgi:hypothetical protein